MQSLLVGEGGDSGWSTGFLGRCSYVGTMIPTLQNKIDSGETRMKFYVLTQNRENYGAHDWDGTGSCPQYWKAKGGDTFVLEDLSVGEAQALIADVGPILACIERGDEAFVVSVLDYGLLDDCEPAPVEDWETPIHITWDADKGCLWCRSVSQCEYRGVTTDRQWELHPGGEIREHSVTSIPAAA